MDRPNAWIVPDDLAALVHPDARPAVETVLLDLLGPVLDDPAAEVPDLDNPAVAAHLRQRLADEGLVVEHGQIRRG